MKKIVLKTMALGGLLFMLISCNACSCCNPTAKTKSDEGKCDKCGKTYCTKTCQSKEQK